MDTHFRERLDSAPLTILEVTPELRMMLEIAVEDALDVAERLTQLLDVLDGDFDLEPTGDETDQYLGWGERGPSACHMSTGEEELDNSDLEDGGDHEDDQSDREPDPESVEFA